MKLKMKQTRNSKLLKEFVKYCEKNQEQRFWQALRNFADVAYVYISEYQNGAVKDTFYFENKND